MSIYKIFCIQNKKVYIGSSTNTYKRWNTHKCLLRKNKHHSTKLQRAWNKYGEENFSFSIIENFEDVNNLINREQYFIDLYDAYCKGFNGRPKAENLKKHKWSNEQKKAQSKRMIGKKSCLSEDERKKRGDFFRGENNPKSVLNEKMVLKIVELANSQQNACQIARHLNVNHSTVQDVIDKKCWKHITKDLKIEKISQKGSSHSQSKLTENQVFEIKQRIKNNEKNKNIAKDYNISPGTISDIKMGKTWSFLNV